MEAAKPQAAVRGGEARIAIPACLGAVFPASLAVHAPLAQLDRASDYESEGYRFDSCGVYLISDLPEGKAIAKKGRPI